MVAITQKMNATINEARPAIAASRGISLNSSMDRPTKIPACRIHSVAFSIKPLPKLRNFTNNIVAVIAAILADAKFTSPNRTSLSFDTVNNPTSPHPVPRTKRAR